MLTYTALTTLPGKSQAEALGEALEALEPAPTGVGVFEVEDGKGIWEVGGYFLDAPDDIDLALLSAAFGAGPFVVSEVPDQDWVAKVRRELPPVEAGRFFVYGSHDAALLPEGRIGLLIEAAMAFGTGHHGTTLGCLRAYDRLLDDGQRFDNVLDLGCGTAVLAMSAARMGAAHVLASDIDPVAVEVALANVKANGLVGRVSCVESIGFDSPVLRAGAPFDLIFANILKGPLIELAPDMAAHLAPGGRAILSGLLVEQADEIVEVYQGQGLALETREDLGEWSALTLRRLS
ncbi:MAG: 50S ribosomal protein L11 methyltransferase [Planktomarina temperata]|jgi:ribosomal protein L11 methyltransferase|uniref:Ribosomal protein L11 methyltransferase n=2 Tax=Planktomarina TaxID=1284657 RepID=A0AAN0RJP7_9RHOB|nr:putative ribosomal protein L11 methyltransferase [Planktomarina temperata RCA23]MBL6848771.1 50S ribosomal protein L11 methyltransferase [Planktomarina temperata]MDP4062931.1 Ribosomal protein L11 methyltransferase [Rhodobacteraceae bacterium LE17]MDA7467045.1 50S ribosomal protein L11 methyltransferase [Planktomarina temperata]MDA7482165.1 50S ribosomal protein L11 methyltransferase [Planktomarina temperata]